METVIASCVITARGTARPAKGPTGQAFPPATPQRPSKAVLKPHAAGEGDFATPGARNASGHAKTERKKKAASSAEASTKLFEAVNAHGGFLPANMGWFYHLGRVTKSKTMLGHSRYCRSLAFVLRHRNDITGRRPEAVS